MSASAQDTRGRGLEPLFSAGLEVLRKDVTTRMFHLDAGGQYKLRGLAQCAIPQTFDGWRNCFDMQAVIASGIWPFVSYIDVEVVPGAVAAGRTGQVVARVATGRVGTGERGAGALVMGTVVDVLAWPGGGNPSDFTHVGESSTPQLAGRYRVLGALIRPFAQPAERVLRELPPQMAGATPVTCGLPPTIADLSEVPAGASVPERGEICERSYWSAHHTDANQVVYNSEFLSAAEDVAGHMAHASGLSGHAFRLQRARIAIKAPFMAGQAFERRGKLWISEQHQRAVALVSLHAVDVAGAADTRPAAFARMDAAL